MRQHYPVFSARPANKSRLFLDRMPGPRLAVADRELERKDAMSPKRAFTFPTLTIVAVEMGNDRVDHTLSKTD